MAGLHAPASAFHPPFAVEGYCGSRLLSLHSAADSQYAYLRIVHLDLLQEEISKRPVNLEMLPEVLNAIGAEAVKWGAPTQVEPWARCEWLEKATCEPSVYFIAALSLGMVKIGVAQCIEARFLTLAAASPARLTILGVLPGGTKKERELHSRFKRLREHYEWFRLTGELLDFVREQFPLTESRAHSQEAQPCV